MSLQEERRCNPWSSSPVNRNGMGIIIPYVRGGEGLRGGDARRWCEEGVRGGGRGGVPVFFRAMGESPCNPCLLGDEQFKQIHPLSKWNFF